MCLGVLWIAHLWWCVIRQVLKVGFIDDSSRGLLNFMFVGGVVMFVIFVGCVFIMGYVSNAR